MVNPRDIAGEHKKQKQKTMEFSSVIVKIMAGLKLLSGVACGLSSLIPSSAFPAISLGIHLFGEGGFCVCDSFLILP